MLFGNKTGLRTASAMNFRIVVAVGILIGLLVGRSCIASELSFAGQPSKDALVVGGSTAAGDASVSLYTGQHVEVIPLVNLPTNGLGGIAISLSYSGNVAQIALKENRQLSASWVGLGFQLGTEYVFVDHKGSTSLDDDEYFYVGASGESFRLLPTTDVDVFEPASGALWRCERQMSEMNGLSYVVGWIIKKENGIRFLFGDRSDDLVNNRNATWYQMHWGSHVLPGASAEDLPYPIRWDLARVERGQNQWVEYTYEQANSKLDVIAPDSNLTRNYYTQASYPKKIESSAGYAVEFVLGPREDFQPYLNRSRYDYYRKERLERLVTSYKGHVTSHIRFSYDYLGTGLGGTWEKLILTRLQTFDGENVGSLRPTEFAYYTDTSLANYGSIKEIRFPEGGKKEISYGTADPDSVFMTLNEGGRVLFAERPKYAYSQNVMIRKYRLEGETDYHYDLGSFNGFWDWRTVPDITDSRGDSSVTAGEDWVAAYNFDLERFIIFYWRDGQWARDTVDANWGDPDTALTVSGSPGGPSVEDSCNTSRTGYIDYLLRIDGLDSDTGGPTPSPETAPSYARLYVDGVKRAEVTGPYANSITGHISVQAGVEVRVEAYAKPSDDNPAVAHASINTNKPANSVRIDAGNDFFVATDIIDCTHMDRVRRGYLYKKRGDHWTENPIFDQGNYDDSLRAVKLGIDLYAIQLEDQYGNEKSKLLYGKYDYASDTLIKGASVWKDRLIFDVGIDLVTYGKRQDEVYACPDMPDYIHILDFNGQTWNDTPRAVNGLRDLIALENGVVFSEGWRRAPGCLYDQEWGAVVYYIRTADGWQSGGFEIGFDHRDPISDPLVTSGSMSFALHRDRYGMDEYADDIVIYEWNGTEFQATEALTDCWSTTSMQLTDEMLVIYHPPDNMDHPNGELYVKRRLGPGEWSATNQLTDEVWNGFWQEGCQIPCVAEAAYIQAAGDFVVACGDDGYTGVIRDLYHWDARESAWDTLSLVPYTFDPVIDSSYYAHPYVFNGRFFIRDVGIPMDYVDRGFYTFQMYKDTVIGSPQLSVVRSVRLFPEGDSSTHPIAVDYSYDGGVLDPVGNTPRFCRATRSTPYFLDDSTGPDGYTISYFYNDIDDDYMPDPHGDLSLLPPDLNDPMFGVPNGGNLLDGLVYFEYDSSVSSTPLDWSNDSRYTYYSLRPFSAHRDASYRVLVDSVKTLEKGVPYSKYMEYDSLGRRIQLREPMDDDLTKLSLSTFASFDLSSNVFDRPSQVAECISSPSDTQWVSRTQSFWEYSDGDVHLTKKVVWPDASHSECDGSEIVTFEEIAEMPGHGRDQFGNLVAWRTTGGDTASAKYSPDGNLTIAATENGFYSDVLLFNAEYDFEDTIGYDGWINCNPVLNSVSSEFAFTGHGSFRVVDDPNSAGINQGLGRILYADSLTRRAYTLSFWAKSTGPAEGVIEASFGDSVREVYTSEHPKDDVWHLLTCTLSLSPSEFSDLDYLSLSVRMDNADSAVAYFDDIRFSPVDAGLSTKVYDTASGLVEARSGSSNLPERREYDRFSRLVGVKSFDGLQISKTEYHTSSSHADQTERASLIDDRGTDEVIVVIQSPQTVSYGLNATVMNVPDIYGRSGIFVNGVCMDSIVFDDDIDESKSGYLSVDIDDTVTVRVEAYGINQGSVTVVSEVSYQNELDAGYSREAPNYSKTIHYTGTGDSTISIHFTDGLGRSLQQRTLLETNDNVQTLVSGYSQRNARGDIQMVCLPYFDSVGAEDIAHYSDSAEYTHKLNGYYDGNRDTDMRGFALAASEFEHTVEARPLKSSLPGEQYSLTSGHATTLDYSRDYSSSDSVQITSKIDPDGIVTLTKSHIRGKYIKDVVYCSRGSVSDSVVRTAISNPMDQSSTLAVDTGSGDIVLKKTFTNDRGLADSVWGVDYGTKRMLYGLSGQLRLVQDDLRRQDDMCTYFKYDKAGRLIEEGTLRGASTRMTQTNAYDDDFPYPVDSPSVAFRWYYDIYVSDQVINPFDSLAPNINCTPGSLVRIESGDGKYSRDLFYFPEQRKDVVIVKLPSVWVSRKAICHYYDADGGLRRLEIVPHFPDSTDARAIEYERDARGKLRSLWRAPIDTSEQAQDTFAYADYRYNARGKLTTARLGVYQNQTLDSESVVQKVDYSYDSRGLLTRINRPDMAEGEGGVVGELIGGVTSDDDNDHFGEEIQYSDDSVGFFNGRILRTRCFHSLSNNVVGNRTYEYDYNQLGWLTSAEDPVNNEHSRRYVYNALGNRDSLAMPDSSESIKYYYDTTGHEGSSRLASTSLFGVAPCISYDLGGNIVADTSRSIYTQAYDYRDMLVYSEFRTQGAGLPHSHLDFSYDENLQRIRKFYKYWYWHVCDPGGHDPFPLASVGGDSLLSMMGTTTYSTDPNDYCIWAGSDETLYLYDGNTLLATFDVYDNVRNIFISGADGLTATYENNDDAKLHFYLKDHLGSVRVMVHARLGESPVVVNYNDFYPYGELAEAWTSVTNDLKFTGKERDKYSSFAFDYFGKRYYDPQYGRFTSIDRAGEFVSGYSYAGNNPISLSDPDGNSVSGLIGAGIKLWSLYTTGKWMHNTAQLVTNSQLPVSTRFCLFAAGVGEGAIFGRLPYSPIGIGIRVAWNKAAYNRWPGRDELITYGLHLAHRGAWEYERHMALKRWQEGSAPIDAPSAGSAMFCSNDEAEIFAAYYKDDDGIYHTSKGEVFTEDGCTYYCEDDELIDPYTGNAFDPEEIGGFIPNGTEFFEAMVNWFGSPAYANWFKDHDILTQYFLLKDIALNSTPFVGVNMKLGPSVFGNRWPGSHPPTHAQEMPVYVEPGFILRREDWGNILFGIVGQQLGFSEGALLWGAGAAQVAAGNSSLGFYGSHFDDPRDQWFIHIGHERIVR